MGVTLEFRIGDPETVARLVLEVDYDALDGLEGARADFSLHLEPHDLDLLSQELGPISGQAPQDLRPHLKVLVDEADRGVLGVSDDWVAYVAKVPLGNVASVSRKWAERMQAHHEDLEISETQEMRQAVADLVTLCDKASRSSQSVVHFWLA